MSSACINKDKYPNIGSEIAQEIYARSQDKIYTNLQDKYINFRKK